MSIPIIAEVKTKSPFGFQSPHGWGTLFAWADQVGDAISIHTDPDWGGSFEMVALARRLTQKPIIAKGWHRSDLDIVKAKQAGADFVLVVGRVPDPSLRQHCWIEPRNLAELAELPKDVIAVWNARNLSDGSPKTETWAEARKIWDGPLCQASYIQKASDIFADANYALIGEHLPELMAEQKRRLFYALGKPVPMPPPLDIPASDARHL